MKRIYIVLLLSLALPGLGCQGESTRLQGAGSTFVDPMMQEWVSLYEKSAGVQVNYQAKGSGAGIKMLADKQVDFGCSDAPLSDKQLATAGDVLHIPLCMGALVPAYNLPEAPGLVFSGPVLLSIY